VGRGECFCVVVVVVVCLFVVCLFVCFVVMITALILSFVGEGLSTRFRSD